jgi:hypothetical protein
MKDKNKLRLAKLILLSMFIAGLLWAFIYVPIISCVIGGIIGCVFLVIWCLNVILNGHIRPK